MLSQRSEISLLHEDETSRASITIRIGKIIITNVYLPPSMNEDEWTRAFRAIPTVPSDDSETIHLLIGDWNTRLWELTGDTNTNSRAVPFTELIQSRRLTVVPFTSATPTLLNSQFHASTPDFVLVSADHLNSCSSVTVLNERDNSNHFPILLDLTTVKSGGKGGRAVDSQSSLNCNSSPCKE
jgi:hypothetical protein